MLAIDGVALKDPGSSRAEPLPLELRPLTQLDLGPHFRPPSVVAN